MRTTSNEVGIGIEENSRASFILLKVVVLWHRGMKFLEVKALQGYKDCCILHYNKYSTLVCYFFCLPLY